MLSNGLSSDQEQDIAPRTAELQAATDLLDESRRVEQATLELQQEILHRKRVEEALAKEQANLQTVFDVVNVGMLLLDGDGVVKRVNNTISRWVGNPSHLLNGGQTGDFVGCVHAVSGSAGCGHSSHCRSCITRNTFESVLNTGQAIHDVEVETTLSVDGNKVHLWLDISADPVLLDGKRHVILAMNNITERKRAEREREITIHFLRLVNDCTDTAQLIRAAARFFEEQSGCEAVGVRVKEGDDYPYYEARGFPAQFVQLENSLCSRDAAGAVVRDGTGNPLVECMCGNVICGRFDPSKPFFTAHGSFWTNCTSAMLVSTSEADRQARTRNRCNGEGYESVALLPLHVGNQRLGLLQLNDRRRGVFTRESIGLWERLADHLAVALSKFRADERLAKTNLDLSKVNRTLKALRNSSQAMVRAADEPQYLDAVCKIIVEDCGHAMVWVGYAEDDEQKTVRPVAYSGFEQGYLESLKITWADGERGGGPTGTAIRTGRPTSCRNMLTDPRFAPWRDEAVRRGYASSVVLPLIADDKTLGAISIYSKVPDSFSDEEATLLGQLADDLAYGIGAIRFRLAHARAEAALRESEERHQLATSVANEAIWEVNLAAGTTRWNQAYAELFGCPPEATAHGPWWLERVHPEDRDAVESSFREALADGADSWFREYRMKLIDESYAFLHDRAIIVRDSAGRPVRAVGAKLNVTDRKKWETTLERSVRRFSLLAESAETLLQTDQPQQVVDELCRKVMEHLDCHVFFNFLVDESAGRLHLNACAGIPPGDACRIEWLEYGAAICGCAARDGQRIVAECIPTTFDPRTELVKSYGVTAYACHPLFGAGGKVLGTLSFGTRSRETFTEADLSLMKAITDQVAVAMIRLQSRDDLQRTAEDLTRSNRDLEQFAYVASHDLQEPLRMVSGFVQLLQKKYGSRLDAEADQYIEYAVQGAKQMQTLINDLLTYSRVGTRGRDLVPTDTDATLRQVLERFRPSIAETAAEITHGQLPTVRADGTQLVHVFQNLIGNAIKFCGGEPPKIHVDASLQGDAWLFSVRDNGIGIEAEFQERIFLIFQRLHTRQQYPGTGIGLAICKKIVDRHGGRIWVESQAGEGSVFYFTIPI